jgi:diadenylate cyclase
MLFEFTFRWEDAIDILVLAYLFYQLLRLMSGTRALQIFIGLLIVIIASVLAQAFNLIGINWIADNFRAIWFLGFLVIFQPELRLALANIGQNRMFRLFSNITAEIIEEVTGAVTEMSVRRQGALIVFERDQGLKEYIGKGVSLEAAVSEELLVNIFMSGSPLHDGAAIISNGRIMSAAVMLPFTENPNVRINLGARHRAALGIAEFSDAVAVVVSEETGSISLAVDGKLHAMKDETALRKELSSLLLRRRR